MPACWLDNVSQEDPYECYACSGSTCQCRQVTSLDDVGLSMGILTLTIGGLFFVSVSKP